MDKKQNVIRVILAVVITIVIVVLLPKNSTEDDAGLSTLPETSAAEQFTAEETDVSAASGDTEEKADEEVELSELETLEEEESPPETTQEEPAELTETSAEYEYAGYVTYTFRNSKYLDQHYQKHGIEMGFVNAEEYEKAACDVINSPDALYKTEAEDGDGVFYIEETNEFVILSTDGYIRTYFNPSGGKSYFDRQ